jgi:hypothetical protein
MVSPVVGVRILCAARSEISYESTIELANSSWIFKLR